MSHAPELRHPVLDLLLSKIRLNRELHTIGPDAVSSTPPRAPEVDRHRVAVGPSVRRGTPGRARPERADGRMVRANAPWLRVGRCRMLLAMRSLHLLSLLQLVGAGLMPQVDDGMTSTGDDHGLTAEMYANSVMRGTPVCKKVLPNGFRTDMATLCGTPSAARLTAGEYSIRLTGMLTADGPRRWHNFTATVGPTALVRLWVDDHRLVDAWSRPSGDTNTPTTPGLLPNVTIGGERSVFVRVDLRPMDDAPVQLALSWRDMDSASTPTLIPSTHFSPDVSSQQLARRALQETTATGWNHWARRSQLAQIALPQQVGVELGIQNSSGGTYTAALPEPQRTQVRMGAHTFDGSFSALSLVPFPDAPAEERANVTVETAHVPLTSSSHDDRKTAGEIGDCIITAHTNVSANLSLVVMAKAYWGAAATITAHPTNNTVTMRSGDLGSVTVFVSGGLVSVDPESQAVTITAQFVGAGQPLVVSLSFSGTVYSAASALRVVSLQREAAEAGLAAGGNRGGGLSEAYDAMATVIAWNVNFDPRVSVTCPVSRTFESNYDFIFFDWDMYVHRVTLLHYF
eukprot:COSAG02_NODE_918_length_15945_cov_5.640752_2_plen_571_part_00